METQFFFLISELNFNLYFDFRQSVEIILN